MSQTMANLVDVRGVSFSRANRLIFDDISLTVPRGKITAIMGPSGIGKTTLLRLIGGQIPPDSGEILFDGENIPEMSRSRLYTVRKRMSMLFQSGALFTDMNVFDNVAYPLREHTQLPPALLHNVKHNKVLHERVILLTLRTEDAPYVHNVRRVQIEQLSPTFWRVVASYGWRETPNVEEVFHRCGLEGLSCRMMETSFFMSHESLIIGKRPWYLRLRGKLYLILQRNALRAPDQFEIPPNRVIELGTQVEI